MIASKCKEHNQIVCWCQSDNIFSQNMKKHTIKSKIMQIVLTEEEIKKIPNDIELGAYIRKKFLNKII